VTPPGSVFSVLSSSACNLPEGFYKRRRCRRASRPGERGPVAANLLKSLVGLSCFRLASRAVLLPAVSSPRQACCTHSVGAIPLDPPGQLLCAHTAAALVA
jgi:hypothetical protein